MGHIQNLVNQKAHELKNSPQGRSSKPLWKCLFSEFVGTFFLIYIGCSVGLYLNEGDDRPLTATALCWGFLIATLGQTLHYSCDMNPSVTIAKLVTGKTTLLRTMFYIPVQCLGCLAGAYAIQVILPSGIYGRYGITQLADGLEIWRGFAIEFLATFLLVLAVFAASDPRRKDLKGSIPVSIGFAAASIILATAPFTAASLNPARTFGPSVVEWHFENHWLYWVAPITGGALGGLLYEHVLCMPPDEDEGQKVTSTSPV